ncbi:CAP domain-containing protein [Streptomyces viridochromogenes]|uniref:CAP domain-containing protein n=1 Tax=Streptomyces viridochromogenes TaxID=1938 RepID=UPI00131A3952|nr:CAP domain-containing protein [Streptomyces viridochromogenes]
MNRLTMRAAVLAAAAMFGLVSPLPAAGAAEPLHGARSQQAAQRPTYSPNIDYITCEINKERAGQGLPALRISERASDVARSHAADMNKLGRLSFVGSDGRNTRDRLNDASLFSSYYREHLLYGYNHDGWFVDKATDPAPENGFYKRLMSRDVVAFSLGYDNLYWDVLLLGPHRRLVTRAAACGGSAG